MQREGKPWSGRAPVARLAVVMLAVPLSATPTPVSAQTAEPPPATVSAPPAPVESEPSAAAIPVRPKVASSSVPAPALPRDLSPWGMFAAADVVVKAVMIGLALASLMTWTVWLAKAIELALARRRLRAGIAKILAAGTLREASISLAGDDGTAAVLLREAADEVQVSSPALDHRGSSGVNGRVTSRLSRVEAEAGQRMTAGTGLLATIGATAPFVGLFGTVWGIMNAFIGISQSQTTNLAIVAPGIAEALLATALGLVAAIPAVIVYNVFARAITGYRRLLADASAGIERLVSRDLDMRGTSSIAASVPLAAE